MKLLIAGGGTGGHLYPGLAVAEELERVRPGSEVLFIGTRAGIESRVLPASGRSVCYISIGGYLGKSVSRKLLFAPQFLIAVAQSLFHIRSFKPDVVLGTGGYVSAPPVLAAWLLRVPAGLLALDALPSKAVRLLARFTREVYAGFPECEQYLGSAKKVVLTGNPLRGEIGKVSRTDAATALGLDPDRMTVLMFGGSRGAHRLNTVITETLKLQARVERWSRLQFIIQAGRDDFDWVRSELKQVPIIMKILPYIDNMAYAYAASDLVISRSGASVSETVACGLPSILIPYPFAASNHQEYNARSVEKAGAAIVIVEKNLTPELLAQTIERVLFVETTYRAMAGAATTIARPQAACDVTQHLMQFMS
jgi:UDP-N-acetylglucosamine--N-acetylmuramyl-(pentapeptide) pyrophosphoryl-undecaprenol N-acetylglucosamine transferase